MLAIGLVGFSRSLGPWLWKAVPCTLVEFKLTDEPLAKGPFSAAVRFEFEWRGQQVTGERLGRDGWKHSANPAAMAERFANNPKAFCYLPGSDPKEAVLLRPEPAWNYAVAIAVGGLFGWIILSAHRGRRLPPEQLSNSVLLPLSLMFGGAGFAMLIGLSLPLWSEAIQARGWHEAPATVAWAQLRTTRTSKGTSRSADICFQYHFAGASWRSSRSGPGHLPLGGNASDVVSRHPPGTPTTCWVNPRHPAQAVLVREVGWYFLFTLFPLPFCAISWIRIRRK